MANPNNMTNVPSAYSESLAKPSFRGRYSDNNDGNSNNIPSSPSKILPKTTTIPFRRRISIFSSVHRTILFLGLLLLSSRILTFFSFDPSSFQNQVISQTTKQISPNPNNPPKIPHIVHVSYKTQSLPLEWINTPTAWKSHTPTYDFRFWTDEDNRNFLRDFYPWFLETYDSYKYDIQRADAARYFVLLKYGGIYADLDILPVRDITPLLERVEGDDNDDKEMIVAQTYGIGFTNALFAAVPNCTVLHRFVTEELIPHQRPFYGFLETISPHFHVLLSTGPTRFFFFLKHHTDKIVPLPPYMWGECHPCHKRIVPRHDAFFVTVKGGSWYHWDTAFFNYSLCHPQFVIWVVLLGLVVMGKKVAMKHRKMKKRLSDTEYQDDLPLLSGGERFGYDGSQSWIWKKAEIYELVLYVVVTALLAI